MGPAEHGTRAAEPRAPRVAAFFDVDNTIIRGASAYHLARELHRRGFFGLRDILFFARHSTMYLVLGEDPAR
ncbi:HAD-IB family hydrolase, partial [Georgenia sp. 10Sc9-8]|nr:HAD-IB family hydrolase [Georgenia halotolerans]